MSYTAIELEKLPTPDIVEVLSFQKYKEQWIEKFRELLPEYTATVESDPIYKFCELGAYHELLLRARVNDGAKGVMLALATGNDLDQIVALYGVQRFENENDSDLRRRAQLALEGLPTTGSEGGYVFHSLSAHEKVKDVDVGSSGPGYVEITVLSRDGNGTPSDEILAAVEDALNDDSVRPLTDYVTVQSPNIVEYKIEANLYYYQGPDPLVVKQVALERINEYVQGHHLLGHDIPISGIYSALHQPGIQRVNLIEPLADIVILPTEAAYCIEIKLNNIGIDE